MALQRPKHEDREFGQEDYDEDENDSPEEDYYSDEESYYSDEDRTYDSREEQSLKSFEEDESNGSREDGSGRNFEGSYRTGGGSYRSGGSSNRSGQGSDEGSNRGQGDGSSNIGDDPYEWAEESSVDDEASFGEDSYYSDEKSLSDRDRSYSSRKERSFRSDKRSYKGDEISHGSDEPSDDDRSFEEEEVSFANDGETSLVEGDERSISSAYDSDHSGQTEEILSGEESQAPIQQESISQGASVASDIESFANDADDSRVTLSSSEAPEEQLKEKHVKNVFPSDAFAGSASHYSDGDGSNSRASLHSEGGSYDSSQRSESLSPKDALEQSHDSSQQSRSEIESRHSEVSHHSSRGSRSRSLRGSTHSKGSEKSSQGSIRSEGSHLSSHRSRSRSSGDDDSKSFDSSGYSGSRSRHSVDNQSLGIEDLYSKESETVSSHKASTKGFPSKQEDESTAQSQEKVEDSPSEDVENSEGFEGSLRLGEVFDQSNSLFENDKDPARDDSKASEMDDTIKEDDNESERPSVKAKGVGFSEQEDLTELPMGSASPSQKVDEKMEKKRRRKKKKKRGVRRKQMKSQALLDLVENVNDAMIDLEEHGGNSTDSRDNDMENSAHRLLHGFDALLGIFLQLSDELELIMTFAKSKKKKEKDKGAMVPVMALKTVLSFSETLDELFADLKPMILDCFEQEPDGVMDDMLYRLNSLVDLLCETTHRVGERQEWDERTETTYVTLLELMDREALELRCYFDDVSVPEHRLSANIHEAWSATGNIEELRALQSTNDLLFFRQICYEVMVSTDQWCPDTHVLMEICGIDLSLLEEEPDPEYLEEEELAPIPQAAEHVLDKVNGDPLSRPIVMARILRRILPPRAMTDPTLLDLFTSIRNTIRNPLGLSATNVVSISSVPEVLNDPYAMGVGGMGKTTLAAMVAQHPDVRRYFIDAVVWIYVGGKELNYSRYTQCLRELVAQLDFYQGVPLFAELLHVPGETPSKRRRREEGFMIYARDTIADLLHDRSVLIILDDVCFEPDLDWFDFAPMPGESTDDLEGDCALLVTTRCRTLLPAADTVEVDMLDEADAISLLIQESGQLSHALMAESREARSVVLECANHPLAVKSVGRWLNLKHATAGVVSSVEEIHAEVIKSMDRILKGGGHTGTDMMYEILSMSLSPAVNGEPTNIIKFCLAAFVIVFCDREYISDFALTEPTPIIPMAMAELLFETLLEMNEGSLLQEGSLFYAQKKEASVLIPEALSALGVLKVITYSDGEEEENPDDEQFLQVMHFIHHEYGEYLCNEEGAIKDLTNEAERKWNRAFVEAYLTRVDDWDIDLEDAGHSYALEMIISHMIRGSMYSAAADLLADRSFVRGRLLSLGRENSTRRHIKDCEMLFKKLKGRRPKGSKLDPRNVMKQAYQALGSQLAMDDDEQSIEDSRIKDVEVARAHYEIGFSLAEKRCWDAAIAHWETSQQLLVSALGTVEVVAGILYNIGVVYSEMNEYEQALDRLKQCLRIRGTIHGEEHILYGQTIQKIGDIFLGMSDYHEAMESYNWALDVMYREPSHHKVEIGEILDNKGTIHYSKGEIEEALQCHQEALRSKQADLGEDHPELAGTYHHIGNCLSDQGNVDDAIVHFEEAIRLKELDPEGGPERDADVFTIEGILYNLEGSQEQGLECYEKSLQILVTKVPYRKEKVASLLHLIGCVYLMSGEEKKAMKLFEESLQARRKVLGFVHLDVASTLFNMAFLHQNRKRLDRALKCLEEALKIRKLRLPDSEKVAVTHEKIGSLSREIGKNKKAQMAFDEALRIRNLIHGEQHEAVATVKQELGDLMDDLGEYDSAMNHYITALDIRRKRLGLDDVSVAETLYSMGYTLHNQDEPDRALVCFEESLSIRRYQLGEDSKEVGDTLNIMGFLKAKRGELDDALTFLWDALRIRKLQEDRVKVSETLKNIGNVHREKQERDLAVECYEECLRIRRTELGAEHEKVADALIAMGNVQSDMKRTDEAMRSYREALKIRTIVFGEHHDNVAAVLQYMGTMELKSGNVEKARDLLTEFIRIRRDNNTRNDGDYVNVLFSIGNIHKMLEQEEDAAHYWSEAYQVFKALGLEETNPQIAKVMNHLLKEEKEAENAKEKKSSGAAAMFGKMTGKFKEKSKEDKIPMGGKRRRKGKGIQL